MPKFVIALIAIAGLAACNTVEGFGQDVQNTGQAIEDEAD
ncbi:entericidin A/B family lipoprotein [Roseovarius sp. S1116L3]